MCTLNNSSIEFVEPNKLRATYREDGVEVIVERIIEDSQTRNFVQQSLFHMLAQAERGEFGDVTEKVLQDCFDCGLQDASRAWVN